MPLKPVTFQGDSLDRLRDFPADARQQAGQELYRVQMGRDPLDWKPMRTIGAGVREIRVRDASGALRVIYVATFADAVHVLHDFRKNRRRRLGVIWTLLLRGCETSNESRDDEGQDVRECMGCPVGQP